MQNNIRVLCIGDIVGQLGCYMFQKHVATLKKEHNIDAVIVNGENSHSQGRGITPKIANFLKKNGADVITTGNHIWARKEIQTYITENKDLLRPYNFPTGCPGVGVTTFNCNGITVGVLNLQGRIFMREFVDCPFRAAQTALSFLKTKTNIIFVDFHAEATSEKMGLGYFLDGQISALFGTHTHVQTADERILPNGTAYISDLGMTGSLNSMIGMKKEIILKTFLTQMPAKFEVDNNPPAILSGVIIDVDINTGKANNIERVKIVDNNVNLGESLD